MEGSSNPLDPPTTTATQPSLQPRPELVDAPSPFSTSPLDSKTSLINTSSSDGLPPVKIVDLRHGHGGKLDGATYDHLGHNFPVKPLQYSKPFFEPAVKNPNTVEFDDPKLPNWLRDNFYLRFGHRLELKSWTECAKSLFYWSNESANMYTHLVGALAVFICGIWGIAELSKRQAEMVSREQLGADYSASAMQKLANFLSNHADILALLPTFIGAFACLSFSAVFHTFYCHSPATCHHLNKLDYSGIVLLISGSTLSSVYYGLRCDGSVRIYYLVFNFIMGLVCLDVLVIRSSLQSPRYAGLRVASFTLLALSGTIPLIHSVASLHSWEYVNTTWMLLCYTLPSGLLQLVGGITYAIRFPEAWFPGKFDYLFHSHANFHVLVVVAVFVHAVGLWQCWLLWNGPDRLGWKLLGNQVCT